MRIRINGLVILAAAGFLCAVPAGYAQEERAAVEKEEAIDIMGEEPEPKPEIPLPPREKIEEPKTGVPEVPKPVEDFQLGPAEKTRLDELERDYATGKITQTEYELGRDSLFREANITF